MMTTVAPRLETVIRDVLAPVLRSDEFSGSGRTFRRISSEWVHVINIQGSNWGGSFAINLGAQPLVLPDVLGNTVDPKKLGESSCEFRRRLSASGDDQWWEYRPEEESMRCAVINALEVYSQFGRRSFVALHNPSNGIDTVTPAQFAAGDFDFGGFGSGKVRMALVLARLRRLVGRASESVAFAQYGLAHVGPAAALRRELESLVQTP